MTPDPAKPAPDADSGAGLADDQAPGELAPQNDANPKETGEDANEGAKTATKRKRPFWRDLAVIVIAALVLTILLKAFVVQVFSIPSGSMENTLLVNDRILVNKMVYRFRPIERGDVVVFSGAGSWDSPTPPPSNLFTRLWSDAIGLVGIAGPGTDYVKRVIGVPGDHVVCCNADGQITVNGVALSEQSYIYPGAGTAQIRFNITVPAGRLWVMGDNRADSDDSRYRMTDISGGGTIPESAVVGRAFVIIWPLSRIGDLPIPNTFKQTGLQAAATVAAAPAAAVGGGVAVAGAGVLVWRRRRRG